MLQVFLALATYNTPPEQVTTKATEADVLAHNFYRQILAIYLVYVKK